MRNYIRAKFGEEVRDSGKKHRYDVKQEEKVRNRLKTKKTRRTRTSKVVVPYKADRKNDGQRVRKRLYFSGGVVAVAVSVVTV